MTEEQIRKKLSVYLDKNDFDIPSLGDMVDFAQEIATKATKELQEENKELHQKIIYLQNDKEDIIANWYCDKVGKCKIADLEDQLTKWKEDYICLENLKDYQIEQLQEHHKKVCDDFTFIHRTLEEKIKELEKQIEKMKSDVKGNIKWADQNKNDQMWQKLVKMYNQWEFKE